MRNHITSIRKTEDGFVITGFTKNGAMRIKEYSQVTEAGAKRDFLASLKK